MPTRRAFAVLAAAAALAAAKPPAPQGPPPADMGRLLSVIHSTHLYEIELGRLAADRAQSLRVRRYGQRMLGDHRIADRKLMDLARARGWKIESAALSEEERLHLQALVALPAADFDVAFVSGAREGHRETMDRLAAAEGTVTDRAIRRYLAVTMPILHQHWLLAARLLQLGSRA
ncbi:MAG: DUF4142 domain-containing protein [Elusimicrobia bacterium]|nr:DUF4142 domain-containing protein [Elusimicrobiota bacterium]